MLDKDRCWAETRPLLDGGCRVWTGAGRDRLGGLRDGFDKVDNAVIFSAAVITDPAAHLKE